MAMNLDFGGSNEYASSAAAAAGDGGLGIFGIIKGALDAVGIMDRIGKPKKEGEGAQDLADTQTIQGKAKKQTEQVAKANESSEEPVVVSNLLDQAGAAIGVTPLPMTATDPLTPWGKSHMDSIKPLLQIDPDLGILQGEFDNAFRKRTR